MIFTETHMREIAALVRAEATERFTTLVRLAGINPAAAFRGARLRGLDFRGEDLAGYDFSHADLTGSDFTGVDKSKIKGLETAILDGVIGLGPLFPPRTPFSSWRDPSPDLPTEALPEMVTLPAGNFLMGAPKKEADSRDDERPQRLVHVPSFALGRCAVTFGQWDAACDAGADLPRPADADWGRGDRPVINVSWEDAQAYCAWLNDRLGLKGAYRLPTEAEWEYACRAGTITPFSFGARISKKQANNNGQRTIPVGSLPANAWGLHEMHGNVWEWVEDFYRSYDPAHLDGSKAVTGDEAAPRVLRGGSWIFIPRNLRSAARFRDSPDIRSGNLGFRLARTL